MEVWELKLYFYPSAGGFKKKKKNAGSRKKIDRAFTLVEGKKIEGSFAFRR